MEVCFISKGFSKWKKALARFNSRTEHQVSKCHKIAIDDETKTFPELSEMCGKCPVKQQKRQWSLTVYASSKSLNVCSILPGKDRLCRVIPRMNQTLFSYLN